MEKCGDVYENHKNYLTFTDFWRIIMLYNLIGVNSLKDEDTKSLCLRFITTVDRLQFLQGFLAHIAVFFYCFGRKNFAKRRFRQFQRGLCGIFDFNAAVFGRVCVRFKNEMASRVRYVSLPYSVCVLSLESGTCRQNTNCRRRNFKAAQFAYIFCPYVLCGNLLDFNTC